MLVYLTGGYGGAKILPELSQYFNEKLCIICNVGDNIELLSLKICPDIDTVIYALSGLLDDDRTWGIKNDSFNFLSQFKKTFGDLWFSIGDKDLAVHIYRTYRIKYIKLSEVTREIAQALNIKQTVLPCTDENFQTFVELEDNKIVHYQEFYVKLKANSEVRKVYYQTENGIYNVAEVLINNKCLSSPAKGVIEMLKDAEMIVVAPSNPVASIGPILATKGIRKILKKKFVVAISPIVKNLPIKKESILRRIISQEKLMRSIGLEHSLYSVAKLYKDFIDIFLIDVADLNYLNQLKELDINIEVCKLVSRDDEKSDVSKKIIEVYERLIKK